MLIRKFLIANFTKIKCLNELSPDLLINLSMIHQPYEFRSFQSLTTHLKKANILKTAQVEKVLQNLPRKFFMPSKDNCIKYREEDFFQIKPLEIGFNQTITDIAVQCTCLEVLYEEIKKMSINKRKFSILDIGSGSGFMSYALYFLAKESSLFEGLFAIDIYEELINHSKNLTSHFSINSLERPYLQFEALDFEDFIERNQEKVDIINIGFGVERSLINRLKEKVLRNSDGVILGPIIKDSKEKDPEQELTLIRKEGDVKIMNCFFSDLVEKSTKENYKFFVQKGETADDLYQDDKDEEKIKGLNLEIKILEEKFKEIIKELKEKKKVERALGMKEIMEEKEIKEILARINKLRLKLKRL